MHWETLFSRGVRRLLTRSFFGLLALYVVLFLFSGPLPLAGLLVSAILPLTLAAALLARQFLDRHERRVALDRWIAGHLDEYQATSPATLAEIFAPDSPATGADLAAAVEGDVRGSAPPSPLTHARDAAAWRFDVDLLRPEDVRWNSVRRGAALDALVSTASAEGLSLASGGVTLSVAKDAQLLLADAVERIVPWSELSSLGTEAGRLVKDALDLRGVSREDFSGVRVEEAILRPGARVTAFGVVRKTERGLEIGAGASSRAPLVVTTWDRRQIARRRHGVVRVAAAARLAGAAVLLLVAGAGQWNRAEVGTIEYSPGPERYSLDILTAEMGTDTKNWTLKAGDGADSIELQENEIPAVVDRTSAVVVWRMSEFPAERMVIGRDPRIVWSGSRWLLDLSAPVPAPRASPAFHEGEVWARNRSPVAVQLSFAAATSAHSPPAGWTWSFAPDEGVSARFGKALSSNDVRIRIATGDAVDLAVGSAGDSTEGSFSLARRFWAGESPELAWVDGTGWTLDADAGLTASRVASLGIRNGTGDDWSIHVLDEAGNEVGQWEIEASRGADLKLGTELTTDDAPNLMAPGFVVEATRVHDDALWRGPLGACPWGHFDARRARWHLAVRAPHR